ncbi:MAG: hypothetical protein Q7J68_04030 [Thermoplasmata archaeon]|nr:hypothetical protein [Thermoplasmata archaeon]
MKKTEKEEKADVVGIFNAWTDYSRNLENQINSALGESQADCEKLYNGWIDFSKSLEGKIKPASDEEKNSYNELSNIWRNYNNKIGARLNNMVSENSTNSKKIIKMYDKYSKDMMANIMKNGKPEKYAIADFYATGFDSANEMTSQITKLMAKSQDENQKVTELWNDFTDRMNGFVDVLANRNEAEPNELLVAWSSMSGKFGNIMADFFKDHRTNYEDTYAIWMNQTKDMYGPFASLAKNLETDIESLYQSYFERTGAIQKNLMMFQFPSAYALQNEISELKKKVEELEKKLN